ncbi:MAG: hypothetical protein OXG37_04080 [Actinomycetia bacterium]|nr:hypothetical protein [Actinomycetes bacterium]
MSQLWIPGGPGAPAPPVGDFIKRVLAQIQEFANECDCGGQVEVDVLLHDGRRFRLHSMSPQPGFGWVTLRPFPDGGEAEGGEAGGDDDEICEQLIVPLHSIVRFVLHQPEEERRFGFVAPALDSDDSEG